MSGTIYNAVMEKVGHLPFIQNYLNGTMDRVTFQREVTNQKDHLVALGLSDWWIGLLARFPNNHWEAAKHLNEMLYSAGIIPSPAVDEQAYLGFQQQVEQRFSHLPDRFTSIFPEETRIAYTLSRETQPGSIFVAGSYYGYLAVWLIPGLAQEGQMVCSDVDPAVCRLASRNMDALGESRRVKVVCEDAEKLLKSDTAPIDLFVLDAYGSYDHPDPNYHGKAIYGPLMKAALPRLHDKSIILVHNAEKNAKELTDFFEVMRPARFSLLLNTTDNMGVFQL